MGRGRAALLVIVVFLLGVAGGWTLSRLWGGTRDGPPCEEESGRFSSAPDSVWQSRLVDRFTEELDLTPEQQDQFIRILDEGGAKMAELRKQVRLKFTEERVRFETQVRDILDESQWRRFEEMSRRHRHERRARKEHPRWKEENP